MQQLTFDIAHSIGKCFGIEPIHPGIMLLGPIIERCQSTNVREVLVRLSWTHAWLHSAL